MVLFLLVSERIVLDMGGKGHEIWSAQELASVALLTALKMSSSNMQDFKQLLSTFPPY